RPPRWLARMQAQYSAASNWECFILLKEKPGHSSCVANHCSNRSDRVGRPQGKERHHETQSNSSNQNSSHRARVAVVRDGGCWSTTEARAASITGHSNATPGADFSRPRQVSERPAARGGLAD